MPCPICDQKPWNCDCTETERRQYAEIQELKDRQWISVEERLPEEYETVIVFHRGGVHCGELRMPCPETDVPGGYSDPWWMLFKYEKEKNNSWAGDSFVNSEDRWMPLPEPPEGDR